MRGFGEAGLAIDDEWRGLETVWVARTASIALVRCPVSGFVTTKNRALAGAQPIRNACLALRLLAKPDRPDLVGIQVLWILDKGDLPLYYPLPKILASDATAKQVLSNMGDNDCILDTNWRDMSAFALFEPSIKVLRSYVANIYERDEDTIVLKAILRRHTWMESHRTEKELLIPALEL